MILSLDNLDTGKFAPEGPLVRQLTEEISLSAASRNSISGQAAELVSRVRSSEQGPTRLDAFLGEFGLKSDEGVALMCLAEALLRVPDSQTIDDLIADKLGARAWRDHLGQSSSTLVNASTWGLMLTGQLVSMQRFNSHSPLDILRQMSAQLGKPVIRRCVRRAMSILSGEFIMGRTIDSALVRARKAESNARYSFDLLGEGARTTRVADGYFEAYRNAIQTIGGQQPPGTAGHPGMSIKLTALHPRYEARQARCIHDEMYPRLRHLLELAREQDIDLCIDAEEADRLTLSLELFERLCHERSLRGWNGMGLAVQAYGRRAKPVIQWLAETARKTERQIPVRLVKGAYWDTEIKRAQVQGLADYPVFTQKAHTDISYISCAEAMIKARPYLFCAFATHNAHTLTAVLHLAGNRSDLEFQRIHGMGERLYQAAGEMWGKKFPGVRVYAPVGNQKDLLAYLVRRLLENGANSSFVNRVYDQSLAPEQVVIDPIEAAGGTASIPLSSPREMYGAARLNSMGRDLASAQVLKSFMDLHQAKPFCPVPAAVRHASIDPMLKQASSAQPDWDALGGRARAAILRRAADLLETRAEDYFRVLATEAGKTIDDAVAEVREAVDFARYYAAETCREFAGAAPLPDGPTGETNLHSLHGRGVFLCISPWNFPLAIFLGQISAALLAGNSVVAKPAEQTPEVAALAVALLKEAGVPENALHLIAGGAEVGARLVSHRLISGVAFTGGTGTAARIQLALASTPDRPIIPFIAETGGQNTMIVDTSALIEQATDDIVKSAFLSAGQRCSALRILCVQEEIAASLMDLIRGATELLKIGDPCDPATDIGPIIDEAAKQRVCAHIERMRKLGCEIWSGGELDAAAAGAFLRPHIINIEHLTQLEGECFGPVLHVLAFSARHIDELIDDINALGYGLTLGIHSRIDARVDEIVARAKVGNIYVNRDMVGAVVGVQPFGGMGLSGTGPKAGGPLYLHRFAVEKTLSVNIAAKGGDIDLLRRSGP